MKKALFAILVLLVTALFIAGCTTPTEKDKPKTEEPDTWTVIAAPDESDMYQTLIQAAMGSLKDISDQKVNNTNPIFSIDTKLKLEFNDFSLWFVFKMNYKLEDETVTDDKSELKFSAEIMNEEETEVILGAYFMKGSLYLKLMDGEAGKLQFPIKNQVIGDLFPIEYKEIKIPDIALMLSGGIVINGDISGKSRLDGTIPEFQYSFDINLPATLQAIVDSFELETLEGFDAATLSSIIEKVLGVTLDEIEAGELPESSVKVNFATSGQKLTNFKLDLSVDQEEGTQNTLFGGGDIALSVDLVKLTINKEYTSIPFFTNKILVGEDQVNEYTTYPNYIEQSFGIRLPVTELGATAAENKDFTIKAEMKLDLEEVNGNDVLIEILNSEDEAVTGIYFDDGILYLYTTLDGDYQQREALELDIVQLFQKIQDGVTIDNPVPDVKREALEYVAFVIGALRLSDESISFIMDKNFFDVLFPGFVNIVEYGNELLGGDMDLGQMMRDAFGGVDLVTYITTSTYEFTLDLSDDAENFVYIIDGDIAFPTGMAEPA